MITPYELAKAPWLRLLLPFILGIWLGKRLPYLHAYNMQISLLLGCILIVFITIICRYRKLGVVYKNLLAVSVTFLFLLFYGALFVLNHHQLFNKTHFSQIKGNVLHIKVLQEPELKNETIRFNAEVLQVIDGIESQVTVGKLKVSIKNLRAENIFYGDELLITANYYPVNSPRNPAEFDYRQYLANKNIHHQIYLSKNEYRKIRKNSGNGIKKKAIALRNKCVHIFKQAIPNKEHAALLSVLVLGYRAELSPQTVQAFANTGTIHILSVSGLHVGLVYLVLTLLLSPLRKSKLGKVGYLLLILLGIWAYALITGLSAPVSRAGLMISFFVIGKVFNKQYGAFNILAFAAFLLLLINPYMLFAVGFQLSFIAVAGLVYFYPKIAGLWTSKWYVLDKLWKLCAVSLAAQLATFPLSVYYFHQFPVYFLPANLLLVFLSGLLLYGGILLLIISPIAFLSSGLATILSLIASAMIAIMNSISTLPAALISNIWISPLTCILLYLLIVVCTAGFINKKARWLQAALIICILLAGFNLFENVQQQKQRKIVLFDTGYTTTIGFINGRNAVIVCSDTLKQNVFDYSVQPYLGKLGVKNIRFCSFSDSLKTSVLLKKGNRIYFMDQKLILINKSNSRPENAKNAILLVAENPYLSPSLLTGAQKVLSAPGNSKALSNWLNAQCKKEGIEYYDVEQRGAWVFDMGEP